MRFLMLSLIITLSPSCLKRAPSVSGIRVGLGQVTAEFPAIVKITAGAGPQRNLCSATFIDRNVLLTAWHCIADIKTGGVEYVDHFGQPHRSVGVILPEPRLYPQTQVQTPQGTVVKADPAYMQKDIAIVFLPDAVQPPAVMPIGPRPPANSQVQIIGFGQTGFDDAKKLESSGIKRLGIAPVKDNNVRLVDDRNQPIDISGVVMTGGEGAYIQPGDSGGAMIYEAQNGDHSMVKYLVGVSSHGPTTPETLISFFVDLQSEHSRNMLAKVKGVQYGSELPSEPISKGEPRADVPAQSDPIVLRVNCFCAFFESNCLVFAPGDDTARAWVQSDNADSCNELTCGSLAKGETGTVNKKQSARLEQCGQSAPCLNGDCKLRDDQLVH